MLPNCERMEKAFKTRGIILKRINLGEADKLVTFFTPFHGKIVARAHGIRKLKSRKAPHLEILNDVTLFITIGKMNHITEAETNESFSLLRTNLTRVAYAYKIVELVDKVVVEGEMHRNIFDLLHIALRKLNENTVENFEEVVEEFTLRFLWELGYLPREDVLSGTRLSRFLETVMERSLKSDNLLTRLSNTVS